MSPSRSVALLVAALALAGCGSTASTSPSPVPSSPSASFPSALDTASPTPPTAMSRTSASAVAFGTYVARMVQHAIRIRDVAPVMALAYNQATCTVCQQLETYIEGLKKDQLFEVGDDLRLGTLTARRTATGYEVRGPFVYPRSVTVDSKGTTTSTTAADRHQLVVDLLWDAAGSRWRLLDYSFSRTGPAS